ncbi:hypothetical protein JT359_06415 [Candidatus Poribacteria bacterium]|nr:hypothetical protein [Candidatus Poribacteria bacterium]
MRKQVVLQHVMVCFGIACFLQWIFFELFTLGKLGSNAECYAIAQTFVVLIVAPYLGAISHRTQLNSDSYLLTNLSVRNQLLKQLLISQIPILIWIFLSSTFSFFYTTSSLIQLLQTFIVLGVYSLVTGTLGICSARIFRDSIFGTECTYVILSILIGSPFLLMPLDRYFQSIQEFIQPTLHFNPIIAICHIYDGIDIFRTPLLYELTPITSYDFSYPEWYLIGFWFILLGCCSFVLTWLISKKNRVRQFNY